MSAVVENEGMSEFRDEMVIVEAYRTVPTLMPPTAEMEMGIFLRFARKS